MLLGYNTNGLPHHRTEDALWLIAETGYRSVALTVDHHCCNPFAPSFEREAARVRRLLNEFKLACVVETGARFLLNTCVKHEPTLVSPDANDRAVRVDFLNRCIDLAAILGADAVSFWSGILRDDVPRAVAMQRLVDGLQPVIAHAAEHRTRLAFEPEPGMFIESFTDFAELLHLLNLDPTHRPKESGRRKAESGTSCSVDQPSTINHQPADHSPLTTHHSPLGLTIDVGHVHCVEDGPIADHVRQWSHLLFNVHIEDMLRGVHEHLRFGDGEIDFPPVLAALQEIGYEGGVHVELSRHGHMGPEVMRESYAFLQASLQSPR